MKNKKIQQYLEIFSAFFQLEGRIPRGLFDIIDDSCLVPVIETHLRNDSVFEINQHKELHLTILSVIRYVSKAFILINLFCRSIMQREEFVPLMADNRSERLLDQMKRMADLILKTHSVIEDIYSILNILIREEIIREILKMN